MILIITHSFKDDKIDDKKYRHPIRLQIRQTILLVAKLHFNRAVAH